MHHDIGGLFMIPSLLAITVASGITWGPVMRLILGALFDSAAHTIAVEVSIAVNLLITLTYPMLSNLGLDVAYGPFTVFTVLAVWFAWKVLPETKDKKLA